MHAFLYLRVSIPPKKIRPYLSPVPAIRPKQERSGFCCQTYIFSEKEHKKERFFAMLILHY